MCMLALAIAGAAFSAVGAIQQGNAQAAAHNANAKLFEQQATQEEQRAELEADREDRNFRRHQGSVIASIGGSGASLANFSEVLADDLQTNASEVAIIRQGGANRSANLRSQANNSRSQARSSRTAGFIGAGSALFSGISRASRASTRRQLV